MTGHLFKENPDEREEMRLCMRKLRTRVQVQRGAEARRVLLRARVQVRPELRLPCLLRLPLREEVR